MKSGKFSGLGTRSWLGLAALAFVGVAALGPATAVAHAPDGVAQVYVLDTRGSEVLVLLLPEGELARQGPGGVERLGVTALSARYLPDGAVAVVDEAYALWRLDGAGLHAWLPPGSANAPLLVSPDGRSIAYLKPLDLLPGAEFPLGNAVAVRDLAGGEERVLLAVPGVTVQLYGWVGDELVVRVPTWTVSADGKGVEPEKSLTLARLGTFGPNVPRAAAVLPAVRAGSHVPQTSLDQRYLAYTGATGAVVADLATGEYAVYAGRATPWWTESGLTALDGTGAREAMAWQQADFGPAAAASGPVALPSALADPRVGNGAAPGAAQGFLFYRPVPPFVGARQIRVSAYYDLDPDAAEIADWLGWVGSTWIYGRAYDGHRGTDYDGITGDAVYISAPGTVYQVTVDCNNYYPGGPGSFGTHVRMSHGVMADGNTYYTIYGHLKCDGVQTVTGAVYTSLPSQIGLMGNTGYSTGDHLHLEVRRNGQVAVDPYSLGIIGGFPAPFSTIGDVQGTVRTPDGAPAAGARIKFLYDGEYYSAVTGADGYYRFNNLDVGPITVGAAGGARYGVTNGTVSGGALITLPDLVLSNCAGTLTGADGCLARTFDAAIYVTDVTVPDPAVYAPGTPLTKTWRLRNTGTTTWGPGYQLAFIAGDQRGAPLAINVPNTPPGGEADLTTLLNAPAENGMRRGYWRMRNAQGVYFGSTVWVEVNVAPASSYLTLTANPPSPAAAGTVLITATVQGMPDYRAMRLLLDGTVMAETTAASLGYAWSTAGYAAVEHSLTVEAATNADPDWMHPERLGRVYQLLEEGAANAAGSGAAAPGCTVQALPGSVAGPSFAVSWAASGGEGGIGAYEVQFLDSGRGAWRTWLSDVNSTSGTFTGQAGHRYSFRCRATDGSNQTGSFPGAGDTETTVGGAGGGADLNVAGLIAATNPAGGLWAQLTIQNEGAASTGRGFLVDLYLNDPPSGPFDFGGSIYTWVSEPLAAGATLTLAAPVTQGSGEISATLYAYVDSTDVIAETDEGDNAFLTGVTNCLAAEDAYEDDGGPALAKPLNPGNVQAHTIGGPGDEDWFALGVSYGRFYTLVTSGLGTWVDTRLRIVGADGQQVLAANDDLSGTSLASKLGWSPPAPGTYYAVVDNWHPAVGGCDAGYTLSLADIGAGWVAFLPILNR